MMINKIIQINFLIFSIAFSAFADTRDNSIEINITLTKDTITALSHVEEKFDIFHESESINHGLKVIKKITSVENKIVVSWVLNDPIQEGD